MERFNARSPYIIEVDGDPAQEGSKIVIEIYGQDNSTLLKTHTIEKKMFSPTQRVNYYNISPFIYDILNTFDVNNFGCIVLIRKYYLLNNEYNQMEGNTVLAATNGYSDYLQPNFLQLNSYGFAPLNKPYNFAFNYNRTLYYPTLDFMLTGDFGDAFYIEYSSKKEETIQTVNISTPNNINFVRLNLTTDNPAFVDYNKFSIFLYTQSLGHIKLFELDVYNLCEIKYNPIRLDFINRYGGKQSMYFFKNSTQSIEAKGSEYNTNTFTEGYPVYNQQLGQKRIYNKNGIRTIKCNSGWINEAENENIQDIMLSENLILTYEQEGIIVTKAVTLKSSSQQLKTHLNEKVINYELEFEIASALINNVV